MTLPAGSHGHEEQRQDSNPGYPGQTLLMRARHYAALPVLGFVVYSKAGVLVLGDDELRSLIYLSSP